MPPGISTSSDPNTIAQIIVDVTTDAIKKFTKTRTFTVKHSENLSNWTSDEVLATMLEKDKWLKKRRRKPHSEYYKCQLENTTIKLEAVTRKAISKFIKLKTSVKEPKKMWRNINSLLGRKLKNKITELKRRDGTLTCNAKEIADELNRFFASCSDMLNKTPNSTVANTPLEIPVQQSMYLKPTDITEDIDTIDSLKSGSAAGSDGIDPKAIKALKHQLAPSLVTLVNKIFETGLYPQAFKTAMITPLFKSGQKTEADNYRPISVLTIFNKVTERLILKRLISFTDDHLQLICFWERSKSYW